jgi:hypothetical protein
MVVLDIERHNARAMYGIFGSHILLCTLLRSDKSSLPISLNALLSVVRWVKTVLKVGMKSCHQKALLILRNYYENFVVFNVCGSLMHGRVFHSVFSVRLENGAPNGMSDTGALSCRPVHALIHTRVTNNKYSAARAAAVASFTDSF